MFPTAIICVLVFAAVYGIRNDGNITQNRIFIYDTYNYDTRIDIFVNSTTEQVMDFSEVTDEWHAYPTRIHVSTNDTLKMDYPIFITATQQKGVSSWELPLLVQMRTWAMLFTSMARTLCPHDAGPDIKTENRPTIYLTTFNPKNVSVNIKLRRVKDFIVEVNKELVANVTPSTPKYYYFSFDQHSWNYTRLEGHLLNYTVPKSVILMIESDSEICATVSIQNNSCPVFDNEKDMLYQGYHLTMMSKGGITLTQSMFPSGFYIVLIVKESDNECIGTTNTNIGDMQPEMYLGNRMKNFRFRVIATISYKEYVIGALVTFALILVVVLLVLVVLLPCRIHCTEEIIIIEDAIEQLPRPATSQECDDELLADDKDSEFNEEIIKEEAIESLAQPSTSHEYNDELATNGSGAGPVAVGERTRILNDDSDSELEEKPWSHLRPLTVKNLTQAPPETLARRSDRYFWGALTVAIVYALPVVQLLFTYQSIVFQTGDQDLCYYNFLCAHPLGFLSDFNHVFSNVGYILLGLVFMLHVRVRQLKSRGKPQDMGIPQHYGLLYSMGLALVMEGVLSACYHLCPNKMNFQFDSSFMYVIAVLVMLKLYQNRHSDIIPSAHSTFILIAVIMTIGLLGILYPSAYFSTFFTILHLSTCFVLTLKIYYAGDFQIELAVIRRGWQNVRTVRLRALIPSHRPRAILLALANIANWSFAIYSLYVHNKDLAHRLLAILMGNAILYTIFYMVMKLVHREKILLHTWIYCVLAHIAWFTALPLFLNSKTKWSETPAQSRRHNAECTSLQLFDTHDLWHTASAAAMFLSFHMLLTVDDALAHTPRHKLPTF